MNLAICIGPCVPGTFSFLLGFILGLINNFLVPLLFAVAFIVFLYGVFNYFILKADTSDKKEAGKFVLYGLIGFAIMICIWGLVNLVVGSFGLDTPYHPPYPTL